MSPYIFLDIPIYVSAKKKRRGLQTAIPPPPSKKKRGGGGGGGRKFLGFFSPGPKPAFDKGVGPF